MMNEQAILAVLRGEVPNDVWWIYNKQDHHVVRDRNELWAPKNRNHKDVKTAFRDTRIGDVLLHYAWVGGRGTGFRALVGASLITDEPTEEVWPDWLKHQHYDAGHDAFRLKTSYYDLDEPIPEYSIPKASRMAELRLKGDQSVFEADGTYKDQGWIHSLSPSFVQMLLTNFPRSFATLKAPAKDGR